MAELQVHISGDEKVSLPDTQLNDTVFMQENMEQLFKAYEDSLRKLGMDEKIHRIDEVVVKAKKLDKAAEVYKTRTKSIAYYVSLPKWTIFRTVMVLSAMIFMN